MKCLNVILATAILGLAACPAPDPGRDYPVSGDPITIRLSNQNGNLEYCNDSGECTTLPYDGDCAAVEVDIDPATGATCERCITEDGQAIDLGCDNTSVGCVLVTLPDPDCLVCAYVNGAIIYSTCTTDDAACYVDADCINDDGTSGFCIEGQCVFEPGCIDDADCPPGFMCAYPWDDNGGSGSGSGNGQSDPWYGTCVPRDITCMSDTDCPGDMYCELWCYDDDRPVGQPCNADAECGPDSACIDGMCWPDSCSPDGTDCLAPPACEGVCIPHYENPCENVACPSGMHCEVFDTPCFEPPCQLVAECVPNARECIDETDCPMGFACVVETCPATCSPDGVCPPCYGVCEPIEPVTCYSDDECGPDEICEFYQGEPTDPCDPDEGCDSPGAWGPGICVPQPQACTANDDCLTASGLAGLCVEGVCMFEFDCDTNNVYCDMIPPTCPSGQVLTVVNGCYGPCVDPGLCQPASQGCFDNVDCPPMHECLMYCWECDPSDPTCISGCEGVCVPYEPQCYEDADCVDWSGLQGTCDNGMCYYEELMCWEDAECPGDMVCDTSWCGGSTPACEPGDPNCDDSGVPCYGICVPPPSDECFRTGCSGEVCSDQPVDTECVWEEQFMCLEMAICERHADGACSWTMTPEAEICMEGLGNAP